MFTLALRPMLELTDEQFEQICQANRDLKFERTAKGELVIVALTGGETGRRSFKLGACLEIWSDQARLVLLLALRQAFGCQTARFVLLMRHGYG